MRDDLGWSRDSDPPADPALTRMLQAATGDAATGVDWERLHARVMERAEAQLRSRRQEEWYDVVARWIPMAAAAILAAVLLGGALIATTPGVIDPTAVESETPEAIAVARVVASYPEDAVLASLMDDATEDQVSNGSGE